MRALTIRQPWAALIMAGVVPVLNMPAPPPSTLPQWGRCARCSNRVPPSSRIDRSRIPIDRDTRYEWHRRLPPNPPEACGPVEWADGPFPFTIAIHAGTRDDPRGFAVAQTVRFAPGPLDEYEVWVVDLPRGALLGPVTVTGCHHADECRWYERSVHDDGNRSARLEGVHHCSSWAEPDRWHWTLADPQPYPEPIPARGQRGLWTVPEELIA